MSELYQVVSHLGLGGSNGYYVYGSSWGTCLAQEFAVTQPSGLRGLVLDGALCDGQVYITTQWRDRLSRMPTYTQKLLKELEDRKDYSSAAYQEMDSVLSTHFTSRLVPRPACFTDCLEQANVKIYTAVQGHSEFTLGGVLEHWSITERNSSIRVPTIVIMGEYDTM